MNISQSFVHSYFPYHAINFFPRRTKNEKGTMSTIENVATGDAMQYMVSTDGKTVYGKNLGFGRRTIQIGGHLSDTSLQLLSRELLRISSQETTANLHFPQAPALHPTDAGRCTTFQGERCKTFTPASTPGI